MPCSGMLKAYIINMTAAYDSSSDKKSTMCVLKKWILTHTRYIQI